MCITELMKTAQKCIQMQFTGAIFTYLINPITKSKDTTSQSNTDVNLK